MPRDRLNDCPACGGRNITVEEARKRKSSVYFARCECGNCGAEKASKDAACKAWNRAAKNSKK